MEPTKALKFLASALKKGSDVREEMISEVNNLASAIAGACVYTSMRLNQALLAKTIDEKIQVLSEMSHGEIEAHARMNGMCAPIFHAANELERFYSDENLHRKLGKKDDLLELLNTLQRGEHGLQEFMMEFIDIANITKAQTREEVEIYIRQRITTLKELAKAAQECQFAISSML